MSLRKAVIRLAHQNPDLRADLLPLLRESKKKGPFPWDPDFVKKEDKDKGDKKDDKGKKDDDKDDKKDSGKPWEKGKKKASLRAMVIRLAHENPELRKDLIPVLSKKSGLGPLKTRLQKALKKVKAKAKSEKPFDLGVHAGLSGAYIAASGYGSPSDEEMIASIEKAMGRAEAKSRSEKPFDLGFYAGMALGLQVAQGLNPRIAFLPKRMAAAGRHPLDGARGHQLLPKGIARKIPKLYSQDGVEDPMAWVKFFNPYGRGVWYVTEFDGRDTMFGWADMGHGELGYISLSELQGLNKRGLPMIERDLYWSPRPLSKAKGT